MLISAPEVLIHIRYAYDNWGTMGKRGAHNIQYDVEDVIIELTDNAVFTPNKTDATKYDIVVFSEAEYATKVDYTTLLGSSPIAGMALDTKPKLSKFLRMLQILWSLLQEVPEVMVEIIILLPNLEERVVWVTKWF